MVGIVVLTVVQLTSISYKETSFCSDKSIYRKSIRLLQYECFNYTVDLSSNQNKTIVLQFYFYHLLFRYTNEKKKIRSTCENGYQEGL